MRGEGLFWHQAKLSGALEALEHAERSACTGVLHYAVNGLFTARLTTAAAWAGVSIEVAWRALRKLVEYHLVEKVKDSDGRGPAHYRFNLATESKRSPVSTASLAVPAVSPQTEQVCLPRHSPPHPYIRKSSKVVQQQRPEVSAAARKLAQELDAEPGDVQRLLQAHGEAVVEIAMQRLRKRKKSKPTFGLLKHILDNDGDSLKASAAKVEIKAAQGKAAGAAARAEAERFAAADRQRRADARAAVAPWVALSKAQQTALIRTVQIPPGLSREYFHDKLIADYVGEQIPPPPLIKTLLNPKKSCKSG